MSSKSMLYMNGLVPRIVNHILSYTCLVNLKIEHQDTGIQIGSNIQSSVYMSFCANSFHFYYSYTWLFVF